jgi:MFS family permease
VFGVVVPVYPFLLQEKKIVSSDKLQLYTSILTAAFPISDLVTAPVCAFFVDHYHSRRTPWFVGLVGIVVGNVLFGVGNSFALLLLSRLLQGASSAILYTVGLAVLVESVDKKEVGTFMGLALSCNNFGIIMSPLLGGALYDTKGKIAVFGMMTAISGLDIAMRVLMQEGQTPDASQTLAGSRSTSGDGSQKGVIITTQAIDETSLSTNSAGSIILADSWTEKTSGRQEVTITITTEARPVSTINRFKGVLKLIRSPRLLAALYGCFINECIVASLCAVLPLFVERTFRWGALQAGCLFLAIAIPGLAGSLAGMLADKLGARWVSVAGFVLTTPSLIAMMAVKEAGTGQAVLLCALLTMAGE